MQTAFCRWPTLSEAYDLVTRPAGHPSLGLPDGAQLVAFDLHRGFPLLRVDPDVPPGSVYLFTVGEVLEQSGIPAVDANEWLGRALRLVNRTLRRLLLALNVPLAWTAPAPDPHDTYTPPRSTMTAPAPPRLPIPGGVRVVHKGTVSGQQVFMTHGVLMTGPPTVGHLQALANGARDAFQTHVRPRLVSPYAYSECLVADLSPDSAASAIAAGSGNGGAIADPTALNAAAVVQWRTARAGRSYRGRTFCAPLWPGCIAGTGRTLHPDRKNEFVTAWTAYRTAIDGLAGTNGAKIAVLSERLGTAEPVTSVTVSDVLGSQRGRLR